MAELTSSQPEDKRQQIGIASRTACMSRVVPLARARKGEPCLIASLRFPLPRGDVRETRLRDFGISAGH